MNSNDMITWIEGYLYDKHSIEAWAIKNKIQEYRSGVPTSDADKQDANVVASCCSPTYPTTRPHV